MALLPDWWPEWIGAWFVRIPEFTHKQKVVLLLLLRDPEVLMVKTLVYQVKKLCFPSV